MKINSKSIKEITITDKNGNLLVSLTDENLITHDSVNVELVEDEEN